MDNKRIEQIRLRKKQRTRKKFIKLAILIAGLFVVVSLIVSGIKGISRAIRSAIPTPSPTPVAIVTQSDISNPGKKENTTVPNNLTPIKIPGADENNDLMNIIENSGSDKKMCYLTFDDGPNNTVTPKILDILRRYGIKATFFQVGTLIEANPDICRRVFEEGHLIANHTYDHTYAKIYANDESFLTEFNKTAELIQEITGESYFPLVRFPGGSHNTGTYGEAKQKFKKLLADNGFYYCDWNVLSGDAESSHKTPEQLINRIKTTTSGQNQIVVLMHDAGNKKQTAEALPAIIEYLIGEGYSFSTLNRLF